MRKNVKLSKKKQNKLLKINKIANVSYLFDKCLKMKIYKILGR